MAQIPQYDAGNLRLQPSDRAAESSVMAGRRIAQQFNEAADATNVLGHEVGSTIAQVGNAYEEHQFHKEVSSGSLAASNILLQRQTMWNDRIDKNKNPNFDPNDPTLQPQFLQENEAIYEKFRDSFSTKKGQAWAEHRIEAFRNHFDTTTTADISSLAGVAAHNNAVQSTNMLTSLVDKDPSSLGIASDMLQDNISALREAGSGMKGAAGALFEAKAKQAGMEALVKAAVQSSIRRGGDGSEITDDPRYSPYVNAQERQQFVSMQRQEDRARRADENYARLNQQHELKQASDATRDSAIRNIYADVLPDGEKKLTAQDIVNIPSGQITPESREHLIRLIENKTKGEEAGVAPAVAKGNAVALMKDIWSGKVTDISQITADFAKGKIDYQRYQQAVKEFRDFKDPQGMAVGEIRAKFLKNYGAIVNPPDTVTGKTTDQGNEAEFRLFFVAHQREAELRKANKNPQDTLYNPDSPEYLGRNPAAQAPSPADILKAGQDRASGKVSEKDPPKPPELGQFSDEAKYDRAGKFWYVTRDGKKQRIKY